MLSSCVEIQYFTSYTIYLKLCNTRRPPLAPPYKGGGTRILLFRFKLVLFQEAPTLLFELLEESPLNAEQYRFDSVAVKEPKFEIDGVFLPPDAEPGVVYFCEVQFQRDELLYERLFGESFLYFYRNRQRFTDWEAVVIYPTRSTEQSETHPYRSLLNSNQVHRVYLDELGAIEQLPLGVGTLPESITTKIADLSIEQIETLAEELLDFQSIEDLEVWLENLPQED
jgi:predicted transposase YdaD